MPDFTVGISATMLEPSRNRGILDGIAHVTQQLIDGLRQQDITCKMYSFPGILSNDRFINSNSLEYSFPTMLCSSLITQGKVFKCNPKVDIFHSTDYRNVPMKCPVVTSLWDVIPLAHPEWMRGNNFKQRLISYLLKRSVKFADHVIAPSTYTAHDIEKYFKIPENKISIIPLAVDDTWFMPIDQHLINYVLTKYNLPFNYFLSVGTLQPRKNIDTLVEAYLALSNNIRKNKKLVIVGKYGWKCEELVKKIQLYAETKDIIWLNNVDSDQELRAIYKAASMFIFPSLYEGFGLPILEAFASGIPVISSNLTSLPELCGDAAILVDPTSISELSEAMTFLTINTSEYQKQVELGYNRASLYSWKNMIQSTVDIYKHI